MQQQNLHDDIQRLNTLTPPQLQATQEAEDVVAQFLQALQQGQLRAAQRNEQGQWQAVPLVKQGILLAFRLGTLQQTQCGDFTFVDKHTLPVRHWDAAQQVRVVPGGTTVRQGAYVANGVVVMPPSYMNVGAYVDAGTMVDSHVLVGSCAQVGKQVHLSAAVQLGGVLEPISAVPVVVEDNVFVGGGVGLYEGTIVRTGAVIAAGVVLTASTKVYDVVHERVLTGPCLEIPAHAVVVPGSRPAKGAFARHHGVQVAAAVIVKYRDQNTDAKTVLEETLR
ncbi:MAG: 2,3,4,5-tetrahydropyridine-2,6-dicarboxylate N-succinyltransferase [Myxococcota bacterium]